MKFKILILTVISTFLLSCSSYYTAKDIELIKYYSHPDFGEVSAKSSTYIAEKKKCEAKIYSRGIVIYNERITSRTKLNRARSEVKWGRARAISRMTKSKNPSLNTLSNNVKKYNAQYPMPNFIKEIEKLDKEYDYCVNQSLGFKRTGQHYHHRKSGAKLVPVEGSSGRYYKKQSAPE